MIINALEFWCCEDWKYIGYNFVRIKGPKQDFSNWDKFSSRNRFLTIFLQKGLDLYEYQGYTFYINSVQSNVNIPDGYMATMNHRNGASFALFYQDKKECEQGARQAIETLIEYNKLQKEPKVKVKTKKTKANKGKR